LFGTAMQMPWRVKKNEKILYCFILNGYVGKKKYSFFLKRGVYGKDTTSL